MNLGAVLKTARERGGLTQDELALKLHTTKSCISKYENDRKEPRISILMDWMKQTNAQDLIVAAMLNIDPVAVAEGLRYMSQLIGGMIA